MYALKKLGKISSFFDFLGEGLGDPPPPVGNRDIESPWAIGLKMSILIYNNIGLLSK